MTFVHVGFKWSYMQCLIFHLLYWACRYWVYHWHIQIQQSSGNGSSFCHTFCPSRTREWPQEFLLSMGGPKLSAVWNGVSWRSPFLYYSLELLQLNIVQPAECHGFLQGSEQFFPTIMVVAVIYFSLTPCRLHSPQSVWSLAALFKIKNILPFPTVLKVQESKGFDAKKATLVFILAFIFH